MNLQTFLEEVKNVAFVSRRGNYTEIFLNPDEREFRVAAKEFRNKKYIRIIANSKNKKFWIFRPDVFHYEVISKYKSKFKNEKDQLLGTAVLKKGKWTFDGADMGVPDDFDWNWLKKKGISRNKKMETKK